MGLQNENEETIAEIMSNRSTVYLFLATLWLKELTPDLIEQIKTAIESVEETKDGDLMHGMELMKRYLRTSDSSTRQKLASDYARCMLAAGSYEKRCATPYESVFTSESGLLMQEARDEVLNFYRKWGMDVQQEENNFMPEDHLAFELQFMSFLCEEALQAFQAGDANRYRESVEAQSSFLSLHLANWIDDLCNVLFDMAKTDLYKGLALATKGFIYEEQEGMKALVSSCESRDMQNEDVASE